MPPVRIELTTFGLQDQRSATKPRRHLSHESRFAKVKFCFLCGEDVCAKMSKEEGKKIFFKQPVSLVYDVRKKY